MRENVKPIELMSEDKKVVYAKILALMVSKNIGEENYESFYRLLAYININEDNRIALNKYIFDPKDRVEDLCFIMTKNSFDQEKNILRFSLIKDLLIIMRSGDSTVEEKQFFYKIKELLHISDEYMGYFEEEYQQDQRYLEESVDEGVMLKLAKDQIALTTSLGIPATYLYYKGYLRDIIDYGKNKSILEKLQRMGVLKRKSRRITINDLLIAISLGLLTYSVAKYLIKKGDSSEQELKKMISKRAQVNHEQAISFITEDIEHINTKIDLEEENENEEYLKSILLLLESTLMKLRASKPILL